MLVRDIAFRSVCEHHLLPFLGTAHVAYLPADAVLGLGRIPKLIETAASRPQVQERLTEEIADAIEAGSGARGVLVVLEAEHTCVTTRGARQTGSTMVTVDRARRLHGAGGPRRADRTDRTRRGVTLIMGVLNVTPDSFSDGGLWLEPEAAIEHALELVEQGADIVDVGGESTRPGALRVDPVEERARVVPVVRGARRARRHRQRRHDERVHRARGGRGRRRDHQRRLRRPRRPGHDAGRPRHRAASTS